MMRFGIVISVMAALAVGCSQPEPAAAPITAAAPPASAPAPVSATKVSPVIQTPPQVDQSAAEKTQPVAKKASGGHRAHEAPHGGSLIEFGEEFAHLELLLSADTGRLTVYALDGEAEKPVRLTQPSIAMTVTVPDLLSPISVTLEPVANALTGEKAGDTSQFVATVPQLRGRREFTGTVTSLTIRGQAFSRVRFEFPTTEH